MSHQPCSESRRGLLQLLPVRAPPVVAPLRPHCPRRSVRARTPPLPCPPAQGRCASGRTSGRGCCNATPVRSYLPSDFESTHTSALRCTRYPTGRHLDEMPTAVLISLSCPDPLATLLVIPRGFLEGMKNIGIWHELCVRKSGCSTEISTWNFCTESPFVNDIPNCALAIDVKFTG